MVSIIIFVTYVVEIFLVVFEYMYLSLTKAYCVLISFLRVPGATVDASKLIERKAREKMAFRQKIRELLAAGETY